MLNQAVYIVTTVFEAKKYASDSGMHIKSYLNGVGIAKGYELDDRSSIPGRGKIFIPSPASTHLLSNEYEALKRPVREADHSLPSSAEVKNGGAIPPFPHVSTE
jgi:hypothetical protein